MVAGEVAVIERNAPSMDEIPRFIGVPCRRRGSNELWARFEHRLFPQRLLLERRENAFAVVPQSHEPRAPWQNVSSAPCLQPTSPLARVVCMAQATSET